MALIKCKECGKKISDTVRVCPNCGYKEKKQISKKNCIIIGVIVIVLIISALIIGIFVKINKDKQIKEYEQSLVETGGKIYVNGLVSQVYCYDISKVWYNTIFKVSDSKYDEYTHYQIIAGGNSYFNSDFNDSIKNYINKNIKGLSKLDNTKEDLSKNIKELKNTPNDKYKETYAALVDFYGVFSKLVDFATNPSGSLTEYSKSYHTYSSDFEEAYNKVKVLLPEVEKYKDNKNKK